MKLQSSFLSSYSVTVRMDVYLLVEFSLSLEILGFVCILGIA